MQEVFSQGRVRAVPRPAGSPGVPCPAAPHASRCPRNPPTSGIWGHTGPVGPARTRPTPVPEPWRRSRPSRGGVWGPETLLFLQALPSPHLAHPFQLQSEALVPGAGATWLPGCLPHHCVIQFEHSADVAWHEGMGRGSENVWGGGA